MVVFNPSVCYLLCRARCEHLIPEEQGNRARGCLPYIKIKLSLSIVGGRDDSSIANMRVLSAMGSVPRGGLTRSVERDMSSSKRTGGQNPGRCNQYLFSDELSLLCEGILDFSCILCSARRIYFFSPHFPRPPSHHSPWGSDERVHAVQRTGVLGVFISRLIPEN